MNKSLLLGLICLITLLTSNMLFSAAPGSQLLPEVSPQDFIARVTAQNRQVQAALDNKLNQLLQSRSTSPGSINTSPPPAPIETPVAAPASTPPPAATTTNTPSDSGGFNMYSP
ncbi:MAG: hypothetical protein K0R24_1146 [Gammaproteobacteria bacterium]|jgi:hypothetical protein|nr:hypothetical protein [Gammaproteobacteria bacterium]